MNQPINALDLLAQTLQEQGFDGLFNTYTYDGCACTTGDLAPCNCGVNSSCIPGYMHTHSEKPDLWAIARTREPMTDAEIERANDL